METITISPEFRVVIRQRAREANGPSEESKLVNPGEDHGETRTDGEADNAGEQPDERGLGEQGAADVSVATAEADFDPVRLPGLMQLRIDF